MTTEFRLFQSGRPEWQPMIVIRKSDGRRIFDICQSTRCSQTRCHQNSSRIGYVSDDCEFHVEFFKDVNQSSSLESPTSNWYSDQNIWWPRNSSRILIRVLELWSESRWPQNYFKIFYELLSDFSLINLPIRWLRNSFLTSTFRK